MTILCFLLYLFMFIFCVFGIAISNYLIKIYKILKSQLED